MYAIDLDAELTSLMSKLNTGPTKVFCLRARGIETWKAMWRGRVSLAEWRQRGPAQAWVELCERAGKFRS